MSKRPSGDGTITHRPERKSPWMARTSAAGGRKRTTKYFTTKDEAAAWLRAAGAGMDAGTYIEPDKITVAQWMTVWLETYVKPSVRIRTWEGYVSINRNHIEPVLGRIPLQRLLPSDIQQLLNKRSAEGLSERTLRYIVATINPALKQAIEEGLITRNSASAVRIPKGAKKPEPKRALNREELQQLYDESTGLLHIAIRIMAEAGLRMGELLGLTWSDIDMVKRELHVRRAITATVTKGKIIDDPKNATSKRKLPIPALLYDALLAWRRQQAQERLLAGVAWADPSGDILLTMSLGTRAKQEYISDHLKKLTERLQIKDCSPHSLRHTFATQMILSGVDPKTVQEMLGHKTIRMAMEVYAHSNDIAKRQAMDVMTW